MGYTVNEIQFHAREIYDIQYIASRFHCEVGIRFLQPMFLPWVYPFHRYYEVLIFLDVCFLNCSADSHCQYSTGRVQRTVKIQLTPFRNIEVAVSGIHKFHGTFSKHEAA